MSTIGPIDYIGDQCPDDVVPKLTTEVIDAVTYHLFTCMDDIDYNQVRDAVESFISLINNEATQNNKGKMVQKVAKAANKMIMLQKEGKVEEAFETTQKLMDENNMDWHVALTRESRKRRLSGGFPSGSKRPNMAMSENGYPDIPHFNIDSDTMSTGRISAFSQEIDDHQSEAGFGFKTSIGFGPESLTSAKLDTDLPDWPVIAESQFQPDCMVVSPFQSVEILGRLYFGFCLRPKAINKTLALLRETNPTHILMCCTDERNFLADNQLQGKVIKKILHDEMEDDVEELKQALQYIHLSRFQDHNTVVAVCCDSAYYSHSGFIIASYIQAFLGHRIDWGLRAIKGYHIDFAVRPHDVKHFEKFLEQLSPQMLESLEDQVGDTNDVKQHDIGLYLQGIEQYTKWTNSCKDRYCRFGYQPWKLMMEKLSELDYFHQKHVDPVIPSFTQFTQPCFEQVTANAKQERYAKSDQSMLPCN